VVADPLPGALHLGIRLLVFDGDEVVEDHLGPVATGGGALDPVAGDGRLGFADGLALEVE
jgi:hypothetical protein